MTADWAMVFITVVYVVATIFICRANIKAANASKEQLQEMQKQFEETNRPNVEVEFHYVRKQWYLIRFINYGTLTAQHVRINLDHSFIESLPEEAIKRELKRISGRECIIGVGQHYDVFIGSNELRGNPNMKPVTGSIEYKAQGKSYKSEIFVDLECYMPFFSIQTEEDDMHKVIKELKEELRGIKKAIASKNENIEND